MKTGVAHNMIISGIDQDKQAALDYYSRLTPTERGELADWIVGNRTPLRLAPPWVLDAVAMLASVAFLDAGLQWAEQFGDAGEGG